MPARWTILLAAQLTLITGAGALAQAPSFLNFESGHVRPLALSSDGARLYAVNTPDGRLEILDADDLSRLASVEVGLEPVAVALRGATEAWVVNHLSDSVSIVDLAADPPRVVRTLLVGDAPRDLVFAGGDGRAFVTTARRGQHRDHPSLAGVPGAGDPRLTTPGVPRADVWVFDPENLGDTLGGTPLAIVELFGDTPRALAKSPDGSRVYVAVFLSGNRTTTVSETAVCDGFDPDTPCPETFAGAPGGLPGPATDHAGAPAPETGLIVQHDGAAWRDELGRDWSPAVRFDLPDLDVFELDADTLEPTASFAGVGTVIYGLAVHPGNGRIYAANTEARNGTRFSGPGRFAASTVQGRLHETRVTVLDPERPAGHPRRVLPRHLNGHIDYAQRPAPAGTADPSLAIPAAVAISSDGRTLYLAALGSDRIGVVRTPQLDRGNFDPTRASRRYLEVAGGPSGLVLDEARGRLYVTTRFDHAVSALELPSGRTLRRTVLPNAEPAELTAGRPLFYDARDGSSNGEASCASCHVFADTDGLAWDLGNPDADVVNNPLPILRAAEGAALEPAINGSGRVRDLHPMKGPMTTLTLRGIAQSGALHWRGDRSVGPAGVDAFDVTTSLLNFAPAWVEILGRRTAPAPQEMARFAAFARSITPPPNPIRVLANSGEVLDVGLQLFDFRNLDNEPANRRCGDCHTPSPLTGNYGTSRDASFQRVPQIFKIPHLRALYQKVGMFGMAAVELFRPGGNEHLGDQVRGFGFGHDGSVDTLFRWLRSENFNQDTSGRTGFRDDAERRQLEAFLLAYDTDLAPIVGQQVTVTDPEDAAARQRVELLVERASTPFDSRLLGGVSMECDLIVKTVVGNQVRGAVYRPLFLAFESDRDAEPPFTLDQVLSLAGAPGGALTFTCVPPGSGTRLGLDRDEDGFFDRDELDAGRDPADPLSFPGPPRPRIVVDPLLGGFGEVEVGRFEDLPFTVTNAGSAPLELENLVLAGEDAAQFAVPRRPDGCSATTLEPGQGCAFVARLKPSSAGAQAASLLVRSNDPDDGEIEILLRGTAVP